MTMRINIANEARGMSDGELSASIRALADEQARRAAIPEHKRPNPEIVEMLKRHHEMLYGKDA